MSRHTCQRLSGTVRTTIDGSAECASGVLVELRSADRVVERTVTDAFGDYVFEIDNLAAGDCEIRVGADPDTGVVLRLANALAGDLGTVHLDGAALAAQRLPAGTSAGETGSASEGH
jgi:hypothetical protein